MKTEDLIEALNLVSQDYIMETRPEPAQHCESRKQKCDAAGVTKQTTFSRSNAAPGKDHTLKTNTITHTHRIMKGLAAVAACAVFICGGWMILKLKDQQQIGMVDASVSESNSSERPWSGSSRVAHLTTISSSAEKLFFSAPWIPSG